MLKYDLWQKFGSDSGVMPLSQTYRRCQKMAYSTFERCMECCKNV
jgi:hypothetical protein